MNLIPIVFPFLTVFVAALHKVLSYKRITEIVILLALVSTVAAWNIVLYKMSGANQVDFSFEWLSIGNLQIDLKVDWTPATAFASALVSTSFLLVLIFRKQKGEIVANDNHTLTFLSLLVFAAEFMLGNIQVSQIIIAWYAISFFAFILLGDNCNYSGEKNKYPFRMLISNLIGVSLFLLFALYTNLLTNHGLSVSTRVNISDLSGYLFLFSVSITMIIVPFNSWITDLIGKSIIVSGFVFAMFMIVGSYALYFVLTSIELSQTIRILIAVISLISMIVSSLVAGASRNIDTSIAYVYSAISSYVLFVFAVVNAEYAIIFAAIQFIGIIGLSFCAGAITSALSGERDMTKMGGLMKKMPLVHIVFFISVLSILSIPPFSSFFARVWAFENIALVASSAKLLVIIGIVIALFVLAVSFGRILALCFYGKGRVDERILAHMYCSNKYILFSTIVLASLAIGVWLVVARAFEYSDILLLDVFDNNLSLSMLPVIAGIVGLLLGIKVTIKSQNRLDELYAQNGILANNLFLKDAMDAIFLDPFKLLVIVVKWFKNSSINEFSAWMIEKTLHILTKIIEKIHKVQVTISAIILFSVIGVITIIFIYVQGGF